LLLALPANELRRLLPQFKRVPCKREQVLMDADSSLEDVYFPDSGVISIVAVYPDGSIIEGRSVRPPGFSCNSPALRQSCRGLPFCERSRRCRRFAP
jgi:hypothetical protein